MRQSPGAAGIPAHRLRGRCHRSHAPARYSALPVVSRCRRATTVTCSPLSFHPMLTTLAHRTVQPARAWLILTLLLVALSLYLALTPHPPPPSKLMWDKLNHAVGFAGLTLAASLSCGHCGQGHQASLRDTARPALLMLAFGALIELLQSFVPERSAEWADLLADGIGVVLGAWLAWGVRRLAAKS